MEIQRRFPILREKIILHERAERFVICKFRLERKQQTEIVSDKFGCLIFYPVPEIFFKSGSNIIIIIINVV